MAATARFQAIIDGDESKFLRSMRNAETAGKASSSRISRALGKIDKAAADVARGVGRIAGKMTLAASAATALGAAVGVAFVKSSVKAAASLEDMEVQLTQFTGSAASARGILEELSAFADKTPFETEGLQKAATQLVGAGVAGQEVVNIVKEIAAVSSDTGQVNELADALGKGFAKNKFQTEELNKFLERSINLMPELARVTGKSGDELTKAVEDGLKFDQVRKAIANMSKKGGSHFGILAKKAETFTGKVSTARSLFTTFQRRFGKPIKDSLSPLLDAAIATLNKLNELAPALGKNLADALSGAVSKLDELTQQMFGTDFSGLVDSYVAAFQNGNFGELLQADLETAFESAVDYLGSRLVQVIPNAVENGFKSLQLGVGSALQSRQGQGAIDKLGNVFGFDSEKVRGNIDANMTRLLNPGLERAGEILSRSGTNQGVREEIVGRNQTIEGLRNRTLVGQMGGTLPRTMTGPAVEMTPFQAPSAAPNGPGGLDQVANAVQEQTTYLRGALEPREN